MLHFAKTDSSYPASRGDKASLARSLGHPVESSPAPTAGPIVFVVDDDVSVREALEAMISTAGWDVVAVEPASALREEAGQTSVAGSVHGPEKHRRRVDGRDRGGSRHGRSSPAVRSSFWVESMKRLA